MNSLENCNTRIEKGIFGFSFFSWQGWNHEFNHPISQAIVWILMSLMIVSILLMIVFRKSLVNHYKLHNKKYQIFLKSYSGFLIFIFVFRIIIFAIGNYPNTWELIPLHFCRMFILLIACSILLNKIDYIKYFGFFAIGGGIIGLIVTDLNTNCYWSERGGFYIGFDSYTFWDFYIIHISSVLLSIYLLFVQKTAIVTKNVVSYSIATMIFFTTIVFILDLILVKFVPFKNWKANWFYLAPPEENSVLGILKILGPIAQYPFILITYIAIGVILYSSLVTLYFVIDKLEFTWKRKSKWKITILNIVKSETWSKFKNSNF